MPAVEFSYDRKVNVSSVQLSSKNIFIDRENKLPGDIIVGISTFRNLTSMGKEGYPSKFRRKRRILEGNEDTLGEIKQVGSSRYEKDSDGNNLRIDGKRKYEIDTDIKVSKKMKVGTSDCSKKQPDQKQVLGTTEFGKEGS